MKPNTLYYGDCLEVMREWPDACVDLIYLDPPFNSNADYNIIYGREKMNGGAVKRKDLAQLTAFTDTWEWNEKTAERIRAIKRSVGHRARNAVIALDAFYQGGAGMLAYLVYMADRIDEMPRLLKDTGSFYLHCDPTASHYLKMILDDVFGAKNFRNEIVWAYSGTGRPTKKYKSKSDTILFYTKSEDYLFNVQAEPYTNPNTIKRFDKTDSEGNRYKIWNTRGIKRKVYMKNQPLGNVWNIDVIGATSKERLGYPTQKPLALLDRIIKASSNEGDVVLDPFCGCGTTIEAAMNLKRDFVGIDISMLALDVIQKERLKNIKFNVEGTPRDLPSAREMAKNRPFAFEKWAVHLVPGFVTNNKQTGDGGVDGWAGLLNPPPDEDGICIAQVKGGKPNVDALRAFAGKIKSGEASAGVFITMQPWDTPTVRQCVAEAGKLKQGASEYNRLVMWSIAEYFAAVKPDLPPLAHPRTGRPLQEDLMVSRK